MLDFEMITSLVSPLFISFHLRTSVPLWCCCQAIAILRFEFTTAAQATNMTRRKQPSSRIAMTAMVNFSPNILELACVLSNSSLSYYVCLDFFIEEQEKSVDQTQRGCHLSFDSLQFPHLIFIWFVFSAQKFCSSRAAYFGLQCCHSGFCCLLYIYIYILI